MKLASFTGPLLLALMVYPYQPATNCHNGLLGNWKAIRYESNLEAFGDLYKALIDQGFYYRFRKTELTISGNNVEQERKYATTGEQDKKSIDITHKDYVSKGIYKIENNQLFLCFPTKKGGNRPSEFRVDGKGQDQSILVFERADDKKKIE